MPDQSIQPSVWAAIIGTVLGWLSSFFSLRPSINSMKERVVQLERDVVYRDTCAECKQNKKERDDRLVEAVGELKVSVDTLKEAMYRHLGES